MPAASETSITSEGNTITSEGNTVRDFTWVVEAVRATTSEWTRRRPAGGVIYESLLHTEPARGQVVRNSLPAKT
jgi:hypothetical protein